MCNEMSSKIFFLRHASTMVDLTIPSHTWELSPQGIQMSQEIAFFPHFSTVKHIYCSMEKKTYLTISPFAEQHKLLLDCHAGLDEVHFKGLPLSDPEQFKDLKFQCFQNLDLSISGSETFRRGLNRFKKTLSEIQQRHLSEDILIVSHGTILSLFFADLLGILNDGNAMFNRWCNLSFCAWGAVESGSILHDLSRLRIN
ncbi:hypothetical protein NEF87_003418 [Candidatus Lokiarchaeum ossiferum]|uniref:Histidine phosphatase family protein n=1 Tax=Candidatus Lokiarchaeum ossiferum TaxID=2951803 RepID=A0ABY6HUV3_9ARCH|nr:hypothetical protein NEF87_003418 [Candidatus Lokiarchaeum sp. B-35]